MVICLVPVHVRAQWRVLIVTMQRCFSFLDLIGQALDSPIVTNAVLPLRLLNALSIVTIAVIVFLIHFMCVVIFCFVCFLLVIRKPCSFFKCLYFEWKIELDYTIEIQILSELV